MPHTPFLRRVLVSVTAALLVATPVEIGLGSMAHASAAPHSSCSAKGKASKHRHKGHKSRKHCHTGTRSPVGAAKVRGLKLVMDDEFGGHRLDPKLWRSDRTNWTMNRVVNKQSNVRVANGKLALTLASSNSGATIQTRYRLPVGGVVEARMRFPGNGRALYNWPAFWLCEWGGLARAGGENDIAEVLGGRMTSSYHAPRRDTGYGPQTARYLGGAWHVWSAHRLRHRTDVYLDGRRVKSWATHDGGHPQSLLLTIGDTPHRQWARYGSSSRVYVDYVRAWQRTNR